MAGANDDRVKIWHCWFVCCARMLRRVSRSRETGKENLTTSLQTLLMGADLHGFAYQVRDIAGAHALHYQAR
jgi:hypothetical protein